MTDTTAVVGTVGALVVVDAFVVVAVVAVVRVVLGVLVTVLVVRGVVDALLGVDFLVGSGVTDVFLTTRRVVSGTTGCVGVRTPKIPSMRRMKLAPRNNTATV